MIMIVPIFFPVLLLLLFVFKTKERENYDMIVTFIRFCLIIIDAFEIKICRNFRNKIKEITVVVMIMGELLKKEQLKPFGLQQ